MRVALAHDYVTQRGGAERVALSLCRLYPDAPLYTALYNAETTFPEFSDVSMRLSPLQRVGVFRNDPRLALPLLSRAWQNTRVEAADVIIASSSGWAHGLTAGNGIPKIIFCHNPARWLYQQQEYSTDRLTRQAMTVMHGHLRRWDQTRAATAALYIANSTSVAARVRKTYNIDPVVIYPPSTMDRFAPMESVPGLIEGDFYLAVCRGRAYKNVHAAVEGIAEILGQRLVVVGRPPAGGHGTANSDRVRWLGVVSDAQLRWLYASTRALVTASFEDFGLTPIEANTFGTPVIALRAGGFLDTVREGVSGVFVDEPTGPAIAAAARSLPDFDTKKIVAHAELFSEERFHHEIQAVVREVLR